MASVEVKESGKLEDKSALIRTMEVLGKPFKGVLVFVRGKDRKSFVLDEGKPCFPKQNFEEAHLSKGLLEKNLMTQEQLVKIQEVQATGRTFYQAAEEVLTPQVVQNFLLQPWVDDLAIIFGWDIGQYACIEFIPKDVVKLETTKSLANIFYKALLAKFTKKKPNISPNARYEPNPDFTQSFKPEDLEFSEIEAKVFEALKKSRSIKQVAQDVSSMEAVVGPIVYSLRALSMIRADTDPKKRSVAATTATTAAPQINLNMKDEEYFGKIEKMNQMDYFQLLGVNYDSTLKDVQEMYFALAKKYHPDRLKNIPNVPVKDAETLFSKITEAYNTLTNPLLRKEYEMKFSNKAVEHENLMQKIMDSEVNYLEGKALLTKGLYQGAIEKIQKAIELYDQEPEYYVKLGWGLFRLGIKDNKPQKIQEGRKVLMDCYTKGYHLPEVSYYLGMLNKHENKLDQAVKFFQNCLRLDPSHALAGAELRALEKKIDTKTGKKR